MDKTSTRYIDKLAENLFEDRISREAFRHSLLEPQDFPAAAIWLNRPSVNLDCVIDHRETWQPDFIDRIDAKIRLGSSKYHQDGDIYLLDFSSVFEGAVLTGIDTEVKFVLDVCSAPGGKAVFSWRLLKPDFILCNEVINKRCKSLISNLKRCGISPAAVSGYDSSVLSKRYRDTFDLVIVDAPCSGQSIIAKGEKNPGSFHPLTIKRNSSRQRRILANSAGCVNGGGYLAYMTCTFSLEENEKVLEWFVKKFPEFNLVDVSALKKYRSPFSQFPCYRMFPHEGLGAGGFTALFRRESDRYQIANGFGNDKFFWRSF